MAEDRELYTAKATCDRGWWVITVPAVQGAHTEARTREEAVDMTREVIALVLDVPESSFDIQVDFRTAAEEERPENPS